MMSIIYSDMIKMITQYLEEKDIKSLKKVSKYNNSVITLIHVRNIKVSRNNQYILLYNEKSLSNIRIIHINDVSYSILPTMTNVEEIYADHTCVSLIPNLLKLKILHCKSCWIYKLPEILPNLEDLNCFYNERISYIPPYEKLKKLCCAYNKRIIALPFFPDLEELDCECTDIEFLEQYPKLRILNCKKTRISELPRLEHLEKLHCDIVFADDADLKIKFPKLKYLNYYRV